MMLAEISSPETILSATGVISAVTAIIVGAYSMSRKSQERIVTLSPDVARREDLEAHVTKTGADIRVLHEKIERGQKDQDKKLDGMSREMNRGFADMERAIGRLEGKIK
jgi:hypothetical protein